MAEPSDGLVLLPCPALLREPRTGLAAAATRACLNCGLGAGSGRRLHTMGCLSGKRPPPASLRRVRTAAWNALWKYQVEWKASPTATHSLQERCLQKVTPGITTVLFKSSRDTGVLHFHIPEVHIVKWRKNNISVGFLPHWKSTRKLGMPSWRRKRDFLVPECFVKNPIAVW